MMPFRRETMLYGKDPLHGLTFEEPALSSLGPPSLPPPPDEPQNPGSFFSELVSLLGFDPDIECVRYRGYEVSSREPLVRIRTKTGGPYNRETFAQEIDHMRSLPGYVCDFDWKCDITHMLCEYRVNTEQWRSMLERYASDLVQAPPLSAQHMLDHSEPNTLDMWFAEQARHAPTSPCYVCYEPDQRQRCSRCKSVRYCSAQCQLNDWPRHKKDCKPPV